MTIVFVDRRREGGARTTMRLGRRAEGPDSSPESAPWPLPPAPTDDAWPDWKVGPRQPAANCGVIDLYTTRMVRNGVLPSRPGVRPPPARPGADTRPVVCLGRGTRAHEIAKRPGPCPVYRRLRVGGPLRPGRLGQRAQQRPAARSALPPERLVTALTVVIVLFTAVSGSFT
ncbi:MAG: hypothetical protein M3121_03535 [Chloroflexota bacterium]|nr:hypothetical protein [Chloroflexota bacterium]